MAKRKIVWSNRAKIKLYEILEFYKARNKNTTYSKKLYKKINRQVNLLIKQPDLGIKTEIDFVRGLIVDDYFIFYENLNDEIIIVHTIWDCRQDPVNLVVK